MEFSFLFKPGRRLESPRTYQVCGTIPPSKKGTSHPARRALIARFGSAQDLSRCFVLKTVTQTRQSASENRRNLWQRQSVGGSITLKAFANSSSGLRFGNPGIKWGAQLPAQL